MLQCGPLGRVIAAEILIRLINETSEKNVVCENVYFGIQSSFTAESFSRTIQRVGKLFPIRKIGEFFRPRQ